MNRINLIALGVRDMEKSLAFFREIGFQTRTDEKNPPIVFFNNEGSKLELFPLEELARDINAMDPPALSQGGFPGLTLACNMKSQEEVDAAMKRAAEAGATIAKKPQQLSWGGYGGYFMDLDGYYWEVAYGPDWEFDEQNMLVIE
ncbi:MULTISPECIES: VOC family protein [unclassified Jeotgalibaca]|uniref:VOC family protein n=1 Tax=unclassified Jeotgalibaca TaxID=2621505 RepID=UPI003FD57665